MSGLSSAARPGSALRREAAFMARDRLVWASWLVVLLSAPIKF